MAGGALNYLASNFEYDVSKHREALERVRDALLGMGENDAAAATDRVVAQIDKAVVGGEDLTNVWREVEWMLSGDAFATNVAVACARWRQKTPALNADLRGTFLKLWSKAVGTDGYNRREWSELQERIEEATRYGRARDDTTQPDADRNRRR